MITRVFEQEWDQVVSKVNHRIEKNVLFDFYEYVKNMRFDLKALKRDYEQEFNKFSEKPLDYYWNLFEKRIEQFFSILIKNYNGDIGYIDSYEKFNKGIVIENGSHHKIADKYYKVLNKIATDIFEIEDQMAPIVEKLWQKEISDIKNYDKDKEYFLLAHVDRKSVNEENLSKELKDYSKSQQGICFSVITDKKTRLFNNLYQSMNYYYYPQGAVGIIANPKQNSIVGMSNTDMLSIEYVDGKCELAKHFDCFDHSKVDRCLVDGKNEICCKGTKICPPKEIFNISADTINEVILDSKNIDVQAVFYIKTPSGELPERLKEYKAQQEKICGHKLPIIEVKPRNYLNQINLDEIYGY